MLMVLGLLVRGRLVDLSNIRVGINRIDRIINRVKDWLHLSHKIGPNNRGNQTDRDLEVNLMVEMQYIWQINH